MRGEANKAVGIIPARWKSKRFPGKPLRNIAGKPLLRWVWERCSRAKNLNEVIIATDDMRIAQAAFDWGAEVAFTSPRHKSGTDRVAEVARKSKQFDFVVNIQGDEPLIDPGLIDRLVSKLRSDRKIEMVTAGHPFENANDISSPHQVKAIVDRNGVALDFSRTMTSPPRGATLLRHQGIYAFRRPTLLRFVKWKRTPREKSESLEQLRALENGVNVHVLVTSHGSPGIDTPADAKTLQRILARGKSAAAAVSAANRKSQSKRLSTHR